MLDARRPELSGAGVADPPTDLRDTAPMPFDGTVVVTPVLPEGRRWRLVEGFRYQGNVDSFAVPADFVTDFASVPRVFVWLLPRYGRWTQAAILHDFLWKSIRDHDPAVPIDKFDADGIFNRAMRELGVPYLRRWLMWTAVRWASGPRQWLARGPLPLLEMVAISLPALVLLAVPTVIVLVALVVGALGELVAYLPLKLLHRDRSKAVNPPEVRDVLVAS
jgi:Protein of unknown function (DUF1353)